MITPHPIIAITPTTRVLHSTVGNGRHVAAVWRGFRLAATYVIRDRARKP